MSTCYNISDAWPFSVYNKCNFRIMWCEVGLSAFRSSSSVPHPKIFPLFFFRNWSISSCVLSSKWKKILLSAWTTLTLLLRLSQGTSARALSPGCLWQSTNCHDKNRWLFIFLFEEHTVYLEISLSKVSWVTSRLYYIRPCAVLIE